MNNFSLTPDDLAAAAGSIPVSAPTRMLNLLRYRRAAEYAEGNGLPACSGREAYFRRYVPAFQESTEGMGIKPFSRTGWHCIAPDMRGYGASSVGHDWGSAVAWSIASHHPARCRGVVSLCVPYFPRGFALPSLEPLIDRELYPADRYPQGQWDYWLFYRQHFARATQDFESDVSATLALLHRTAAPREQAKVSSFAMIRANGVWFGDARRAPRAPRDERLLSQTHFDALLAAF